MAQHYELADPDAQISVEETDQLREIRKQTFGPQSFVGKPLETNKYEPAVSATGKEFTGWNLPSLTIERAETQKQTETQKQVVDPPLRLPVPRNETAVTEPAKVATPKVEIQKIETPKVEIPKEQVKPVDLYPAYLLSPTDGIYSPAGPPGLGESQPGESFGDEKEGNKGFDIDWRESKKSSDKDGNTVYEYNGEIDDSSAAGIDGDTNFQAQEVIGKNGQLLKRTMKYDGRLDFKVKTDGSPKDLKGVTEVTSTFNPATESFETEISCENGARYKSQIDYSGKVISFEEIVTKVADTSVGVATANVTNFSHSGDIYHPARPIGVGGAIPGWAGGDNGPLDFRTAQVIKGNNGEVTYKYEGEIDDSTYLFNIGGDTNFKGQEVLDANSNLISSSVDYDGSKDMSFIGVGGQPVEIEDVKTVKTARNADGSFLSTVTTKDGSVRIFKFKADGTVVESK